MESAIKKMVCRKTKRLSHIYPLTEKFLNYLKDNYGYFESYSKTIQSSYLANHCSNCKVIQGDFYLFGEVYSPFFIDSEERARQLKLYKIPLKNDIIVEANIGWGSEDWMIETFVKSKDLRIDGMLELMVGEITGFILK